MNVCVTFNIYGLRIALLAWDCSKLQYKRAQCLLTTAPTHRSSRTIATLSSTTTTITTTSRSLTTPFLPPTALSLDGVLRRRDITTLSSQFHDVVALNSVVLCVYVLGHG